MGKLTGLAKDQRRTLGRLKIVPGIERFYLAGGTAVAAHVLHRRSLDLDLFSVSADVDLAALSEAILVRVPDLQVISMTEAALRVRVGEVPVDVVKYPYALLDAPAPGPEAFPTAGVRDLAAMKMAAIARRGLRRDFWDLYALVKGGLPLRHAAEAYVAKFGVAGADLYHVLKSLTYFEDAEKDPVFPRGLTPATWERIKRFFLAEAPALLADER